jgi:hypothetical protein
MAASCEGCTSSSARHAVPACRHRGGTRQVLRLPREVLVLLQLRELMVQVVLMLQEAEEEALIAHGRCMHAAAPDRSRGGGVGRGGEERRRAGSVNGHIDTPNTILGGLHVDSAHTGSNVC